jgi:outer membrane lipoprotein carrier protein
MTHRRALRCLAAAAIAALLGPAAARADGECAGAVAERVQRRYEKIRDLRARFEQRTERAALGGTPSDALVAAGTVVFAKPGKMRWSYESPEPSLVVSDGATLWIYDEKAREVQKLSLAQGYLSAAGVQFLLGDGKLVDEFRITASACGAPVASLLLTPKRDAQYERLELRVDAASGQVAETAVVDLFGNRTVVAFRDAQENAGADAALFRFAPPAGVRVLEMPPAP